MPVLAYFTLPIGHPVDGTEKLVPAESERVCDVLSSSDPDGAYQLYQCVDMDGIPANVTPVCRVHKPLLSTLPKVYLDTSAVSYLKQDDSPEKTSITRKFWEAAKAHKFSSTYPMLRWRSFCGARSRREVCCLTFFGR